MMINLIFLIVGLGFGAGAVWFLYRSVIGGHIKREQEFSQKISALEMDARSSADQTISLTKTAAELSAENKMLKEKFATNKEEQEAIRAQSRIEFENIASRILEEKSKKFTETNRDNIFNILKPLDENLEKFRKKVEEVYDKESKERFSLGREVERLVLANQRISDEANNLTNALKGNSKTQGNWGEMILENILERSGLTKGREYFLQETLRDDDNNTMKNESGQRMIPDVLINYPDNRKVIIDSKVSLNDYVKYAECENDTDIKNHLAKHVGSVRRHIDELGKKSYQQYTSSLDFVMMFIPSEPAYIAAMQQDSELWSYAYNKKVLLINPTNLITSLKLIADLWSREYQNRNAIEIADRGAQLYNKFAGFVESMNRIGENIRKTDETFTDAMKQLRDGRGNLISQVDKLRQLGVKAKRTLAQTEQSDEESDGESDE